MKYKNSEGYPDSTAGIAVKRASKKKKKRQQRIARLTFVVGELYCFEEWVRRWDRCGT